MALLSRIALLDNRLANQIAAGEVVERPASVVKELLENSVDSNATRIEVDIERGGTRLIRVTDNGKGIHKDDLHLALTRHATSKIQTTEDLANILSLGFRGEALASISAVSRLVLTSRTHDSELAWQARAQGRDMAVEVLPAAASAGTRIEVGDLFFNTPARQKFLRTEKTEFSHIEEVFKRQALANFEIAFILKHNHKIIKRVTACAETSQQLERVGTICGKAFVEHAIAFDCQHELMHIHGWLGHPEFHRSESDIQYVFINKRPVKDKTLSHAIRQAYEGLLPLGRMSAYVIFLEVNPHLVDVNVHPTKHEVRFDQQRLVHDLLAKSISDALANAPLKNTKGRLFSTPENLDIDRQLSDESSNDTGVQDFSFSVRNKVVGEPATTRDNLTYRPASQSLPAYSQALVNRYAVSNLQAQSDKQSEECVDHYQYDSSAVQSNLRDNSTSKEVASLLATDSLLKPLGQHYWLAELSEQLIVVDGKQMLQFFVRALLDESIKSTAKSLLFPFPVVLDELIIEDYQTHLTLNQLGFIFDVDVGDGESTAKIILRKVPLWLSHLENADIGKHIQHWLQKITNSKNFDLAECIASDKQLQHLHLVQFLLLNFVELNQHSKFIKPLSQDLVAAMFE